MNLLPALAAAALCLAPSAPRDAVELRFSLPEGGLAEYWTVEVPPLPGATRASIDLELTIHGYVRLEHMGFTAPALPWARLYARPEVVVVAGQDVLHTATAALYVEGKRVARTYDGTWDYGGLSGSTVAGSGAAWSTPTEIDPALFAGGLTLEVAAPATVTAHVHQTTTYALALGVFVGGALVVTVER